MPTKSWDGQNVNHRKKSGWHLVWLAFGPVGILSYHPIQPHELVTHSKEKPFKCDHCNFSSTQVFYLKRHKHNHARDKPFKRYQCNYSPTQSGKVSQHNSSIVAFLKFAIAIASLAPNRIRSSPVEYLQPLGKLFIGITLPELTPLVLNGMVEGQ